MRKRHEFKLYILPEIISIYNQTLRKNIDISNKKHLRAYYLHYLFSGRSKHTPIYKNLPFDLLIFDVSYVEKEGFSYARCLVYTSKKPLSCISNHDDEWREYGESSRLEFHTQKHRDMKIIRDVANNTYSYVLEYKTHYMPLPHQLYCVKSKRNKRLLKELYAKTNEYLVSLQNEYSSRIKDVDNHINKVFNNYKDILYRGEGLSIKKVKKLRKEGKSHRVQDFLQQFIADEYVAVKLLFDSLNDEFNPKALIANLYHRLFDQLLLTSKHLFLERV